MRRDLGQLRLALVGAVIATSAVAVAGADRVVAAAPVITGPETVYTAVDAPLPFTSAADPISQYVRTISISATDSGCAPTPANSYSSAGCATVKVELWGTPHGDLSIGISDPLPANTEPNGVLAIATGGAVVNQAGGANGQPGDAFNFFGTVDQVNAALATLVFTPDSGYESRDTPNQNSELRVDAIDGTTSDGTLSSGESLFVDIHVEDVNDPPDLIVPSSPVGVLVNEERDITAPSAPYPFRVEDEDVEQGEFDDDLLLVGWVDCGLISLAPSANVTASDNIQELLEQQVGLDAATAQVVLDLLPGEVSSLPLASDLSEVEAFAAVGSLDEINDALYLVTFHAPTTPGTCTLRMFVSDLGNNGMPFPALPGQPGTEVPFVQINEGLTSFKPLEEVEFEVTAPSTVSLPSSLVVLEGDALAIPATVTPPSSSDFPLTVGHVPGNPADLNDDYSAPSSIALYTAGSVGTSIQLFTTEDDVVEPDESLAVTIEAVPTNPPIGVAFGNASVAVTIVDDDGPADTTGPTVTIEQSVGQVDPTSTSPVEFTAQFSEPVNGFTASDVQLVCAVSCAGLTTDVTGGPSTYTVTVDGFTVTETVTASVPAGAASDASSNLSAASSSTDNTITFENDLTVTIDQAAGQNDPTATLPITFTAAFSDPVTGFAIDDVAFTGSTATGLVATSVTPTGPTTYAVSVTATGGGLVVVSVPAGVVVDASDPLVSSAASTSTDNQVEYDPALVAVTAEQAAGQVDPTGGATIAFTVTFATDVTGFGNVPGDVALSGTAGATTAVVSGGPAQYTVTVSGMTVGGTVVVSVPGAVVTPANAPSTSVDNVVTWDPTPPTLTIDQSASQPDPTKTSPITFTVVSSEPLAAGTLDGTDISFAGSTAGGLLAASVSGGPTTFTVTVTGMGASGNVRATIPAGSATDLAGNLSAEATFTDNVVRWDVTRPTVTVTQAGTQSDPTEASPILFTVVFSEPVTGFVDGDVTLGGGAGGALAASVSGSGTTYTVSVTGMTTAGTVVASVPANRASDAAGNQNFASTSADNSVLWQPVRPTVTIDQAAAQADPTSTSPIQFRVVFSEPVSGFVTGDVSLGGTAGATTATVSAVSATEYDVAVSGMATSGTVVATLAAGVATDLNGHTSLASTSTDNEVTYVMPLGITVPADIVQPNDAGQAGAVVTYPAPTSSGGTPPTVVTCDRPSGGFYALGTTTVTCTATDSAQQGLSADDVVSDSFTITVLDVEPPTIADNPDLTAEIDGSSAPATFPLPAASDNSGVPPVVACVPASGSSFPLGTTTVTCTATDGAGNSASSSFTVTHTAGAGGVPTPGTTPVPGGTPAPTPTTTPTPLPATPAGGGLPATGSDMSDLLALATCAALLGLALRVAAVGRRRRRALPT